MVVGQDADYYYETERYGNYKIESVLFVSDGSYINFFLAHKFHCSCKTFILHEQIIQFYLVIYDQPFFVSKEKKAGRQKR